MGTSRDCPGTERLAVLVFNCAVTVGMAAPKCWKPRKEKFSPTWNPAAWGYLPCASRTPGVSVRVGDLKHLLCECA